MSDSSEAPFSREDVARMVSHMNEDHADSVLAYAQHFGQCRDAAAATLIDVTADVMTLKVVVINGEKEINIPFEHPLKSGHDVHMTMIKMSKAAKKSLGAL
jgi:putative heme iron utilization protein